MCRIGLWGTFDLEDFGLQLHPRIFRHELSRRLPGADLRIFAPYGYQRPTRWDGGEPAEPLSAADPDEFDCVVVDPSLLRTDAELAADYGVDAADLPARPRPAGFVTAPADYALLAPRVFPREVLAQRLEYLRLMGWYPREGEAVVVEAGAPPPVVPEGRHVVAVELAPYRSEGEPAEAAYRMRATVSHEDVVAALAASAAFVGTSLQASLVAEAYHDPGSVRARQAAVDQHFDQLAEAARAAASRRNGQGHGGPAGPGPDPAYLAALRRAHERRGQRLLSERVVFADRVADLERALDTASTTARMAQQQAADDALGRRMAEADLAGLRATRTFRWSQKPRAAYEWFRHLRAGP